METIVESGYARVVAALGEPLAVVELPRGRLMVYAERIVPIERVPPTMEFASLGSSSRERAAVRRRPRRGW